MMISFSVSFLASILETVTIYELMLLLDEGYSMKVVRFCAFIFCAAFIAAIGDSMQIPYRFVAIIPALFLLFWFFSKQGLMKNIIVDVILCHTLLVGIQLTLCVLIKSLNVDITENPFILFGFLITFVIIVYSLNNHTSLPEKVHIIYSLNRDVTFITLFSLLFTAIMLMQIWYEHRNLFWLVKWQLLLLISATFFLNGILMVVLLHKKRISAEAEAFRRYSEHIMEIDYQLCHRQHEYKNQIQTIIGLTQTLSGDESRKAIANYAKEIVAEHMKDDETPEICSSTILNALIYEKKQEAVRRGIQFASDIQADLSAYFIKPYYMAELLGNLLNNAFEAVSVLEKGERQVSLSIWDNKLEVLNSIPAIEENTDISKWMQDGYSTKGNGRGYGFSNIKSIVEKYNGNMDCYLQGNHVEGYIFVVELLF